MSIWGHRSSNGAGPDQYPLVSGGRSVGSVQLWPQDGADLADHVGDIQRELAGVALAFDNIQLLGTVARRSVQDERNRVARELHDHIGPSLASLGLMVDVLVQTKTDPGLIPQLRKLRTDITELVERIRTAVAELRRADTTTVMDHVHRIVNELGDDAPRVQVAIDERAAADGATAAEVGSILIEAVRNAAKHSGRLLHPHRGARRRRSGAAGCRRQRGRLRSAPCLRQPLRPRRDAGAGRRHRGRPHHLVDGPVPVPR